MHLVTDWMKGADSAHQQRPSLSIQRPPFCRHNHLNGHFSTPFPREKIAVGETTSQLDVTQQEPTTYLVAPTLVGQALTPLRQEALPTDSTQEFLPALPLPPLLQVSGKQEELCLIATSGAWFQVTKLLS